MKALLIAVALLTCAPAVAQDAVFAEPDTIFTKAVYVGTWSWHGETSIVNNTDDTLTLLEPRQAIPAGKQVLPRSSELITIDINTFDRFPTSDHKSFNFRPYIRRENAARGVLTFEHPIIWFVDPTKNIASQRTDTKNAALSVVNSTLVASGHSWSEALCVIYSTDGRELFSSKLTGGKLPLPASLFGVVAIRLVQADQYHTQMIYIP
jgi:hypothetical protein